MYNIKTEIDALDERTGENGDQYTDSGQAWDLLNWIRGQFVGLRPATGKELHTALEQYGTDDVQFDNDAMASDNDEGGVWVQAWVYLRPEED